ncbi:MAG: VanZ family protein [Bacteroidetes bacterium]|nr:VanZ family protein [Bacteroidota bacterium]
MIRKILFSLPLALYSLLIIYLSSLSSPNIPDFGFSWQDKVIHAGAFFVYGIVLQLFLAKSLGIASRKIYIIIYFLIGCFFGASDEFHQYFVPGRSCEFLDWFADTIGLMLALGVILITKNFHSFNSSNR